MSLFDSSRTADALERIALALERLASAAERLAPPPLDPAAATPPTPVPAGLEDVHYTDDAALDTHRRGAERFARMHGVIADSPAFHDAMLRYEEEMQHLYGDRAAVDWDAIFRTLAAQ